MKRPRLTYANVMSTLGVFLALGGTSWAIARNSIGERELKDGAVSSRKVRDGAIQSRDLASGVRVSGPRGPRGAQGPIGPVGPAGPQGPAGPAQAEAWKPFPFAAGWTHYGGWNPAEYRKDQLGVVHLRGLATLGTGAPVLGSVIGTLPAGYRPVGALIFAVNTGGPNGVAGRVNVASDGRVVWEAGGTAEMDWTSLSGIDFSTD